jgi:hypothetical protein
MPPPAQLGRLNGYNTVLAPMRSACPPLPHALPQPGEERGDEHHGGLAVCRLDARGGLRIRGGRPAPPSRQVLLTGLLDTLHGNMPCADKVSPRTPCACAPLRRREPTASSPSTSSS